jgi:hypothetical protein
MNLLNAPFSDQTRLKGYTVYSDVEMVGTDDSMHAIDFSSDDEQAPHAGLSEESMSSSSSLSDTSSSSPRGSGYLFSSLLRLRQRNSVIQDSPPSNGHDLKSEDVRFGSNLLLGPHTFESTLPLPGGPVRKGSDFDKHQSHLDSDPGDSIARLRTREQIVLHFLMELAMLRRDALVLVFGLTFQWVHSASTNFAYYYHTRLSAAQRIPLQDVAFDILPPLTGEWWMASEYLVNAMIAIIVFLIASIMIMRWNPPHRRPLYCIPILRRMLITLVAAQSLRIISFLITTLPGSSRQCAYHVPENLTMNQMLQGPAPSEGNPQGWAPPANMGEIFWRLDVLTGCGDLMFSSHTIFTCLFICVVFQYFNWRSLKLTMVWIQVRKRIKYRFLLQYCSVCFC